MPNNLFSRWSADGQRIAFVSDRDGDPEIDVMRADGSGLTRLAGAAFPSGPDPGA
jgi:TolB protein